jgi:predicted transcriptional regulator
MRQAAVNEDIIVCIDRVSRRGVTNGVGLEIRFAALTVGLTIGHPHAQEGCAAGIGYQSYSKLITDLKAFNKSIGKPFDAYAAACRIIQMQDKENVRLEPVVALAKAIDLRLRRSPIWRDFISRSLASELAGGPALDPIVEFNRLVHGIDQAPVPPPTPASAQAPARTAEQPRPQPQPTPATGDPMTVFDITSANLLQLKQQLTGALPGLRASVLDEFVARALGYGNEALMAGHVDAKPPVQKTFSPSTFASLLASGGHAADATLDKVRAVLADRADWLRSYNPSWKESVAAIEAEIEKVEAEMAQAADPDLLQSSLDRLRQRRQKAAATRFRTRAEAEAAKSEPPAKAQEPTPATGPSMASPAGSTDVATLAASIVTAYLAKHDVAPSDLPGLVAGIRAGLAGAGSEAANRKALETVQRKTAAAPRTFSGDPLPGLVPAVPIEKSITADEIVCLEDGHRTKSLTQYLRKRFGLTPEAYRRKWGLPKDYPMSAPSWTAERREKALRNPAFRSKIGILSFQQGSSVH